MFLKTHVPCSWVAPSTRKVDYAPILQDYIDFTTPSNKRKALDTNTAASITLKNHSQTTEPSEEELEMFYKQILFNYRIRSSLLSIIPGYCCDQYNPKSESGVLPKPLATFFSGDLYRQHILSCWKKVAKK